MGRRGWALPALAGLILGLAHPPFQLLVPAFVGLVPLLVFIDHQSAGSAGRWTATRAGLLTGAIYFGIQLHWLVVALLRYSWLAIPAYVATVLAFMALTGAFAWAVHVVRKRPGLPLAVAVPLLWTLLEWVPAHLGDLSVPWLGLGAALAPFPELAGAADLVGTRGLTLWIAAANGLVADGVLRIRSGRRWVPVAAWLAVVLAVPAGYGAWRAATLTVRPAARVAVVQPNIPEEVKLNPALALDSSMTALTRLTRQLEGEAALDLVVWPEVAVPAVLAPGTDPRNGTGPTPAALLDSIRRLSGAVGAPILVGAWGHGKRAGAREDDGDGTVAGDRVTARRPLFNSAFLVTPGERLADAPRYDKRRLVPFVERTPFVEPRRLEWLTGPLDRFGRLRPGEPSPLIPLDDDIAVGTLICFESIFGDLARDDRRRGADFIVNMTNDAWFGRNPWWGRTTALWQHPAHLVLRAIETRTGAARAANTGISMFVDPVGRVYGRTELSTPATQVATVYTTDAVTLFVRWGDWLGAGAAGAAVVLVLAGLGATSSKPAPGPRGSESP